MHGCRGVCVQAVLTKGFDDMMLVGNFAGRPSMIHNYMNPAAYIHSHHTLQACYCSSSSNNMQLYIHAYMHTCLHAYRHTCIHTYMHACIHPQMHTCIQSYMHTCMNPHMHTCIHKSIQAYIKDKGSMQARWRINAPAVMDIYIYIYIYMLY